MEKRDEERALEGDLLKIAFDEEWCNLCAGNDAPGLEREHTLDCAVAIERSQAIEHAAKILVQNPRSRGAWNRLRRALAVSLRLDGKPAKR